MKSAIFASLIATAAAFAPAQQGKTTSALQVSELGKCQYLELSPPKGDFKSSRFRLGKE